MNNSNFLKRLITCIVGIPIIAAIVFFFPQYNFIGLRVLICISAILASVEISKLVFNKITLLPIISAFMPVLCFINCDYPEYLLLILILISLTLEIKNGESDNFEGSIKRIASQLLCMVYPAYLLTYPMKFTALPVTNVYLIGYYIITVFSNDIFAYVFGMLFGKNNNAGLKASPKKSYAGFAGGFLASIAISLVFTGLFQSKCICFEKIWFRLLCPMLISVFGDLGDLAESVIKRCAKTKDSSHLIPGHGGVLDRLDSIVSTAPFFYIIVRFFL